VRPAASDPPSVTRKAGSRPERGAGADPAAVTGSGRPPTGALATTRPPLPV